MPWDRVVLHSLPSPETPVAREVLRAAYHLRIEWIQISRPGKNVEGRWEIFNGAGFPRDKRPQRLAAPPEAAPIHVCLVSDARIARPPEAAVRRCLGLVGSLIRRHGIDSSRVVGHDEVAGVIGRGWACWGAGGCPGTHLSLGNLRRRLQREADIRAERAEAGRVQTYFAPGFEPRAAT